MLLLSVSPIKIGTPRKQASFPTYVPLDPRLLLDKKHMLYRCLLSELMDSFPNLQSE